MQNDEVKRLRQGVRLATYQVLLLWAIHLLQIALQTDWMGLGVLPRSLQGLLGIITSPLVHQDFSHLTNNSIPLFVSVVGIVFFYPRVANRSLALIYLLTGLSVWLFARPVYHIGASGVVYGNIAFVFWTGVFRKNVKSIMLSFLVIILYSGMLAGLVPNEEKSISWESHLIGLVVGAMIAFAYRHEIEMDEVEEVVDEPSEKAYYFERDAFERTKAERAIEEEEGMFPHWHSDTT